LAAVSSFNFQERALAPKATRLLMTSLIVLLFVLLFVLGCGRGLT
jgi:hypothetical protein